MQENEAVGTTAAEPVLRPDLDMSQYIPDDLQPVWEFFTPYPGLLTLVLIVVAYFFGRLLRLVMSRAMMKVASRTSTDADDHLVEYATGPLVVTTVTLALMMVVSLYDLPRGLHDATLSLLATILLFSWLRAGLRMARVLLELVASNRHRFDIVQERTIPLFDMTIKILLVGFGAYAFLLIWGINPTAWLASAGVIGIAVGFAAKDSLANLFSGIFIVADAPYKIGDYIVLDSGERGMVTNLGMRSTRLVTRDDVEVTVPNAVIANAKIINESGGPWVKHRIRIPVGVAYGSDVDEVCSVLEEVAKSVPEVVKIPAPRVRMRAFGNSSLDFELLTWIDHPELRGRVRHQLLKDIYKAFNEKRIEIPFPQTDIHVRTMPEE
ncbi:mechanosensitive ion channel family protein [Pseudomonadota bacterium]